MEQVMNKEENLLGLDVFINGMIDIEQIPKEILDSIVENLELAISARFEKNVKRRKPKNKKV